MATLIQLLLKLSILLIEFCLGLKSDPQDAMYLFRRPGQLLRSLLSMYIVMPSFALLLSISFHLRPALKIALIALAVSPIPPLVPKNVLKAGGGQSYTLGLLVTAALFGIIFIPSALELLGRAFGLPIGMSLGSIALLVLTTVLLPIGAGIGARYIAPVLADRIAGPLSFTGMLLLIVSIAPILFTAWPDILSLIGNGTIIALIAFVGAGIASGELLGGPGARDGAALALSTASRHPGIALAITRANFPAVNQVSAAILIYLIVTAVAMIPYIVWSRRRVREAVTRPV